MDDLDELFADQLRGDEMFDAGIGDDSVQLTEDGRRVESDGKCMHGYLAPSRRLGLV